MKTVSDSLRAAALAIAALLACAAPAAAQVTWGTYDQPLEGRRFETLRALANYLDEAAQQAVQDATADARYATAADRRLVTQVRQFARQADAFHRQIDSYQSDPGDVTDDVDLLNTRARRLATRIQQARGLESTRDDLRNITDALDRMRRLLNGEDVQVPNAYGTTDDYERDYGPWGNVYQRDRGLSGADLQQFRQLARDLDVSANRAWRLAQRPGNDSGVSRYLPDLERLARQSSDIRQRANGNVVDPGEIGPTVSHLLDDARLADRNMRQGSVLRDVWFEWTRTIGFLQQMNDLVTRR